MTGRDEQKAASAVALRRGALAVSVLHDLDIEPNAQGIRLVGSPVVFVPWNEMRRALGAVDPESCEGHGRLARWLQARRWAADLPRTELLERVRPVGLPQDHPLHPGQDWVRRYVLGDALDLGLGVVGLDPSDPDRVVLLPPPAARQAGFDAEVLWGYAHDYLERMGALAATRLGMLDKRGTLRPLGDCDVVTLLGSRTLRKALAERAGGMASVVAPMLRRGWTELALADPAFAPAAWAATDPLERGFPRPALVTVDELVLAAAGGRPAEVLLRDPVPASAERHKDVLYR